jgi:hypothetical protein
MPLDPEKLRMVTEKAQTLSKRFDAFVERRKAAADDDDDDDDEECELQEPAEAARRASPGSDLDNPEFEEPWWS